MFVGKTGAYLREAFSGASFYGRLLALPTSIIKSLLEANSRKILKKNLYNIGPRASTST
jgi:hypothetical protein